MPARPDHDEVAARGHDLGGDPRRAADHEGRGALDRLDELLGRQPFTDVDLEARGAQGVEAAGGDLFGDEDAGRHRPEGIHVPATRSDPCAGVAVRSAVLGLAIRQRRSFAIRSMPSTRSSSPSANEKRA